MQLFVLAALIAVAVANSDYTGSANLNSAYNAPSYSRPTYEVKQYVSPIGFSSTSSNPFRVLLPDGRVQIVTYKADDYGYTAEVKYEGEAQYPAVSYSAPAYTSSAVTATGPARPSSATVFTSPAVTAPAVSSRTYSAPVFISRPAVTATAGNSRTYSGQVFTSPDITSPTVTGPVVVAPDANSRSYSGQVFTSPAVPAPAVFTSRPSTAPASTSRTYSTPVFTSAVTATGRSAQPITAPATGPIFTTSGNVVRNRNY